MAYSDFIIHLGNDTYKAVISSDEVMTIKSDTPIATRAEVLAYFNNMTAPTISVSEQAKTVTLTFTPVPEGIALGMLQHKMVQFRIARNKARSTRAMKIRRGSNPGYHAKNWAKEYFPYTFTWDHNIRNIGPYTADVTLLNNKQEQANYIVTLKELLTGSLTRNISHIFNLRPFAHSDQCNADLYKAAQFGDHTIWAQFYIGFVYYNEDSKPTHYKMREYLNAVATVN